MIPRRGFQPAYLETHAQGRLATKAEAARRLLGPCKLCPRECGMDRCADQKGFCNTGRSARVSSAFAHFGEEQCLRGWHGSGTIFFAGCTLGCVFCQNHDISQPGEGEELTACEFAEVMLSLQSVGCHNINLVTPTHAVPQILRALLIAIPRGLRLPLVYNTSGYDALETLRLLDGVVDIYMPDFKLWNEATCAKYLRARDYGQTARAAIRAMYQQVGALHLDEDGLAVRGLLVRHLVMPGLLADTRGILHWLAGELSADTYLNLMDQYHPAHKVVTEPELSAINRRATVSEYRHALQEAALAGLWRLDGRA
jgi:putative pyruvate formate lyase activating enzyme